MLFWCSLNESIQALPCKLSTINVPLDNAPQAASVPDFKHRLTHSGSSKVRPAFLTSAAVYDFPPGRDAAWSHCGMVARSYVKGIVPGIHLGWASEV